MHDKLKDLKENISSMSDEDLMKMVYIDFSEYQEEAITLATEELKKRNIKGVSRENVEEFRNSSDTDKPKVPVRHRLKIRIKGLLTSFLEFLVTFIFAFYFLAWRKAENNWDNVSFQDVITAILASIFLPFIINKGRRWNTKTHTGKN